jgi:protein gp37
MWGPAATTARRLFGDSYWTQPYVWNASAEQAGERKRVFCASMPDVFEDNPSLSEHRSRLFDVIDATPWLDWLLLTKRPSNISALLPAEWQRRPRENVWLGTSVEDQQRADERIDVLSAVPSVVRFLSCEPLLAPIGHLPLDAIDWVIVGGESGPGARRMDPSWAREIRDRCREHGAAYFFKQTGSVLARDRGYRGKGHRLDEIPEDLRLRQFPVPRTGTPYQS